MLVYSNDLVLSYLINYMFFYNINLISIFIIILFFNNLIKYLNNLISLNYSSFYKNIFIISILSIAGIPPFLFFFNKINIIFILTLFDYKNILLLYLIFFLALFFYIQTIRYLLSDNNTKINSLGFFFLYNNYNITLLLTIFVCFNVCGFFFLDDFFILFIYTLN